MESSEEPITSDLFEGVLYRHYKGNLYYAHFVAKHSETEEPLVVYQSAELLADDDIGLVLNEVWCRPLEKFCDVVEVEGKEVLRFTPI